MGIEIEKKYTIKVLPKDLSSFPFHEIEQGYLNTDPAIRVRKEDAAYYMTYKGQGVMKHTEYNLPLDEVSYRHLLKKADGNIIRKKRYLIPLNADAYTALYLQNNPLLAEKIENREMVIELDVFQAPFERIVIAEVEFPTEEAAIQYQPADWFLEDVTMNKTYSNSYLSSLKQK